MGVYECAVHTFYSMFFTNGSVYRIFIKRLQYRLQLNQIINCKFAYRQKGELRVNWRDEETFIYSNVG